MLGNEMHRAVQLVVGYTVKDGPMANGAASHCAVRAEEDLVAIPGLNLIVHKLAS
jgi:uncharacterized protein (UPF0218 family)